MAFTTGTGSAQPFGIITHGTSDGSVGALTAAMVYGLHNALPRGSGPATGRALCGSRM